MFQLNKWMGLTALAMVISDWTGTSAQAAWNSAFQTTCLFRRQTSTSNYSSNYYAPPVVAAPVAAAPSPCNSCNTQYVQRSYYEPVTSYERKSYYEPVTTYQTSYYYEPVTTYRYSCYYDPCSCGTKQVATPETSYRLRSQQTPTTGYVEKVAYQPTTSYRSAFYYEPVTTCTQTTTTVGSPIFPANPAPAVVNPPCNTPSAPGVYSAPGATGGTSPGMGAPGVNEQRITPSATGSGVSTPITSAPAMGRMTAQESPRVYLSAPQNMPSQDQLPATRQGNWSQPVSPAFNTPAATIPPSNVRMDRLTSRGREYTQLSGNLVQAPANTRIVFIPANPAQGAEEARTGGAGQFDIKLQSGRYGVYAENGNGRPVFLQNIDIGGSSMTLALNR